MSKHNIIRDRNRELEAIWLMYTRAGWSTRDIAEIFKFKSPASVTQKLEKYAHEHKLELEAYEH